MLLHHVITIALFQFSMKIRVYQKLCKLISHPVPEITVAYNINACMESET